MGNRKEGTSEEMRAKQLGLENLREWDKIHNLAELIKHGKAKIVSTSTNSTPYTIIKREKVFRCK